MIVVRDDIGLKAHISKYVNPFEHLRVSWLSKVHNSHKNICSSHAQFQTEFLKTILELWKNIHKIALQKGLKSM